MTCWPSEWHYTPHADWLAYIIKLFIETFRNDDIEIIKSFSIPIIERLHIAPVKIMSKVKVSRRNEMRLPLCWRWWRLMWLIENLNDMFAWWMSNFYRSLLILTRWPSRSCISFAMIIRSESSDSFSSLLIIEYKWMRSNACKLFCWSNYTIENENWIMLKKNNSFNFSVTTSRRVVETCIGRRLKVSSCLRFSFHWPSRSHRFVVTCVVVIGLQRCDKH